MVSLRICKYLSQPHQMVQGVKERGKPEPQSQWFPKFVPGPAASTMPGNFIELAILDPDTN